MTPIRKVQAYDCTCIHCGCNWLAREIPERCARCKRRTWNLKKGEKPQIGRPKKKP
jgi:hypothetical protein